MAAQGSNVASVFSGVNVVGGGVFLAPDVAPDLAPEESLPLDDIDRFLESPPVDILRYSVFKLCQSDSMRCSWPSIRPQGLSVGRFPEIAGTGHETLLYTVKVQFDVP